MGSKVGLSQRLVQCPTCGLMETLEFFNDKLDTWRFKYFNGHRCRVLGNFYQDDEIYHIPCGQSCKEVLFV